MEQQTLESVPFWANCRSEVLCRRCSAQALAGTLASTAFNFILAVCATLWL